MIDHMLFGGKKYIKQTAYVKRKLDNYDSLNQWKKNAIKGLYYIQDHNGNVQSYRLRFDYDGTLIYDKY